ncbi:MAG: hypothetical protein INR71_11640, partial [Terriglobus roseus]|nr:hypothetical protein [Terriglobus roseus]
MKTSAIFTAAVSLISCVSAGVAHERRQIASVLAVINNINDQTVALNSQITAFNGGDPSSIIAAAKTLNDTVIAGTATINASPVLEDNDAYGLAGPVVTLQKSINTTITNLISKKSLSTQAPNQGLCAQTYQILLTQQASAQGLSDALVSKVSDNLKPTAVNLAKPIADSLAQGVAAYSNCPAPPTSSAPAGGATTVTATVTAPGTTVTTTAPGTTVTAPGAGTTVTAPAKTVTVTAPGAGTTVTVTAPGTTVTAPGAGTTVTAPAKTVTVTAPGAGTTVTVTAPGQAYTNTVTVTAPGQAYTNTVTVTAPGQGYTNTITT